MKLKVNEIYATFQGEGTTVGMPCTFLRLSVCNLHCVWCDTYYTWNFGKGDGKETRHGLPTVKMKDEVIEMETADVYEQVMNLDTKNLVISGGEPMLQQEGLTEMLRMDGDIERVEIETNGTIVPTDQFAALVSQFNVSPKLENSGNIKAVRYNEKALQALEATKKAVFKFVVANDDDLKEIDEIVSANGLTNIILMPLGKTKAEQEAHQKHVAEVAFHRGWGFSPRLHVLVYGDKRGV